MGSFSVTEIPACNMHSSEQMGRQIGKDKMTCLKYPVMARSQGTIHLSVFASFFSQLSSSSLQRKSKHSSKDEKSNLKRKEDYSG